MARVMRDTGQKKAYTSALCWIPAVEQQEGIQELRSEHDRQIHRWPPHVNLLYPFVPSQDFEEASRILFAELQHFRPFETQIRRLGRFKHGKASFTAWLALDGADQCWETLQALAVKRFPHCTEHKAHGKFVPHLTVGQFREEAHVDALEQSIARSWTPLKCTVGDVCLISRSGPNDPFLIHWRVPLGGGTPRREEVPVRGIVPSEASHFLTAVPEAVCTFEASTPEAGSSDSGERREAVVRITLAANANRSLRCAVLVSAAAELPQLRTCAKNKLRLSGRLSFFRDGGEEITHGTKLSSGELILASRGEPYVGSRVQGATCPQLPPIPNTTKSGESHPRVWVPRTPPPGGFRVMTWNMLASVLCTGTDAAAGLASSPALPARGSTDLTEWTGVRFLPQPASHETSQSQQAGPRHGASGLHGQSYLFRAPHAVLMWQRRAPLIASEIFRVDPAVLCLQEVDCAGLEYLRALLSPRGYHSVASKEIGARGSHGLAIFWHEGRARAVGEPRLIFLNAHRDKCVLLQRMREEGSGRVAEVATTHLKAGLNKNGEKERADQAKELLASLETARADEAVIVAGDLNAHHSVIRHDTQAQELLPVAVPLLLHDGGFRCAYSEATGSPAPYTYWAGWTDRDVKAAFDHVLLRGDVVASAALAVPDAGLVAASADRLPNEQFPSDHVPVVVEVALRPGCEQAARIAEALRD